MDLNEPVTLTLTRVEAEALSMGASDLLCWVRGYIAGAGDDAPNGPIGQEEVRLINIKLKTALANL